MNRGPISYSQEELAWIEERKEWTRADLHRAFCNFWRRDDVSHNALKQLCQRRGWLTGRTGTFAKGQASHNKGKPMSDDIRAKVSATWFKKGERPHVDFHRDVTRWGCGQKLGLFSRHKAEAFTVFDRAAATK